MSALRWRLDLINKELSEGLDKVIWMDLSTLIASDMSCLYQKLSHFIYRVRILHITCTLRILHSMYTLRILHSMYIFSDMAGRRNRI